MTSGKAVAVSILGMLLAPAARAGDLADVQARSKLVMLCYPTQNSTFISANLDAMRERGLKLTELRLPGDFKGLDVELMKGFAKSLGVELEIHPVITGYDALLPALVAREGDLVASSITITPKRQEAADFSAPYLTSWIVVAAPAGSKIAAVADLAGRKGAVMHGSSQFELLQTLAPEAKILVTDFSLESYVAVREGDADFTVMDSRAEVGNSVNPSYPDLKVAFRVREFGYGVAARKGSDLLAPFNAYVKGLQESGEMARLAARFDPVPEAKPQPLAQP